MPFQPLHSVQDTSLWKLLDNHTDRSIAAPLAQGLISICQEASERVKGFYAQHSQFTLHDQTHFLNVAERMFDIMPPEVRAHLNPVEITLLILSAFFHDQGMVLDADEMKDLPSRPDFRLHRENWKVNHPNWLDLDARLKDRSLSDEQRHQLRQVENELESAHFTDFVRESHAERSRKFVRDNYGDDPRWKVDNINLAPYVARLCVSHVQSPSFINDQNGFREDEAIGVTPVNLAYLAFVLRLADIVDFDRDRTPETLFRTIDFRSEVSLLEWQKHLSVSGRVTTPTQIQFTMPSQHPEYQRAALQFMDWIDDELSAARSRFPKGKGSYFFTLPPFADRSRIEPKDGAYKYHDLEFSLSRNEIVNLLMTDELYGSPILCIRELVQNAMDALRHKAATFKRDHGVEWTAGKVSMVHELDEHGREVVRCTDNGIGMNEHIIKNFLTNVGRSYYRSPEWKQEENSLKNAGVDFDPCSQFGIGFMSCFMLGDQITIETRRDNGAQGLGEPLLIEINGLGGMVVIRPGKPDLKSGTTINITGRQKPRFLTHQNDKVQLVKALQAYILNCEFPVEANCSIQEIAASTVLPPGFAQPILPLEKAGLKKILRIEEKITPRDSQLSSLFAGTMIAEFLIDEAGSITLDNDEAAWETNPKFGPIELKLKKGKRDGWPQQQIALDGIYVAGDAGRSGLTDSKWNRKHIPEYEFYDDLVGTDFSPSGFQFSLDVRGKVKPPLTPARTPQNYFDNRKSKHMRIALDLTAARIWQRAARRVECQNNPFLLWFIALNTLKRGEQASFFWFPAQSVFDLISLPIDCRGRDNKWIRIQDISEFVPTQDTRKVEIRVGPKRPNAFTPIFEQRRHIEFGSWVEKLDYHFRSSETQLNWMLSDLVGLMSTLTLKNDKIGFTIQEPTEPNELLAKFLFNYREDYILAISYAGEALQFISIHCPCISANRHHPLTREAVNNRFDFEPSRLGKLPEDVLWLLCHPDFEYLLRGEDDEISSWIIEIAHQVLETDWGAPEDGLGPPYRVRLLNGDEVTITRETFERWTRAKPLLDDEANDD